MHMIDRRHLGPTHAALAFKNLALDDALMVLKEELHAAVGRRPAAPPADDADAAADAAANGDGSGLNDLEVEMATHLQQKEGRDAAADEAAERAAAAALCDASVVYVSPLTRALQTAQIALAPLLRSRGLPLTLAPNAREKLNAGGADTIGIAVGGAEVRARAREFLVPLYDGDEAAVDALVAPPLDDLEARSRWWSVVPETPEEAAARVDEVLNQLRHSEHERAILVGHSHFLRELFRRHLRPDFAAARPSLAAALQSHKLSNCGVAALEIDFSAAPGDPLVAGAQRCSGRASCRRRAQRGFSVNFITVTRGFSTRVYTDAGGPPQRDGARRAEVDVVDLRHHVVGVDELERLR